MLSSMRQMLCYPQKGSHAVSIAALFAAFRQYFVKTGEIEIGYSRIFGQLLDDRNISDYVIVEEIERAQASLDLSEAKRFVKRVNAYLEERCEDE